jgi:lipoprotein-anchoring transpeptidase ErfK/SrfK
MAMAYSILIDLAARQLVLYQNGVPARNFPVGVGKMVTPTPTGRYYVALKRPNPGGPFGAMWLGLSIPHYGIHGTDNPASIGHYVSHGCIRMHNSDVLELSSIVPVGTPVTIKG